MTNLHTRRKLRDAGWRAYKLLCQDDNGGIPLVPRWHILKRDEAIPRPGELMGGHLTRDQAWQAAEDHEGAGVGIRADHSTAWNPQNYRRTTT